MKAMALAALSATLIGCGFLVNIKNVSEENAGKWIEDETLGSTAEYRIQPRMTPTGIFESYEHIQLVALGHAYGGILGISREARVEASAILIYSNQQRKFFLVSAGHLDDKLFKIERIWAYFENSKQNPEEVELLLVDKLMDFSVLEFKNPNFTPDRPAPPIGNSDALKSGEEVVSIGFSLGYPALNNTGSVSTLKIGLNYDFSQPRLIAHTCRINPGDSGGGLYNLNGELVGINIQGQRAPNWLMFAVPIEDILAVARRVKKGGYAKHPFLGCKMWDSWVLSEDDFKIVGITRPPKPGIVITRVISGSPAEKAGLKPGDIILTCNGKQPKTCSDVSRYVICYCNPEDKITFTVDRYGQELAFEVQLKSLE